MLGERVKKFTKLMFTGLTMALCVVTFSPAAKAEAATLQESEPNDNPAQANQLPLNTWMSGSSLDSEEQDWYQFTIPQPGFSYLEIKPDDSNTKDDASWNVQMTDINRNVLIDADSPAGKTSYSDRCGWAPGKYYLRIKAYWEFWAGSHGGNYKIMLHYEPSTEWEQEIYYGNKSLASANIVYANKTYTGNLYCGADVDYYRFKLKGKNKITLKFNIDNIVSDPGNWNVEFIEYNTRRRLNDSGEKVNANRSLKVECTGDLIVRISNYSTWTNSAAKQRYHILARVIGATSTGSTKTSTIKKPSATKITSIKAGKRKATIRWKKASKATGYYVYRATSPRGKYKKVATVTGKTSYTDKKSLKRKKNYYYKIVSIRKSGSKVVKAKASAYKRVKIK